MKKVLIPAFLASGLLAVIMMIMFFTGVINFNNDHLEAITNGNRHYVVKKYDKALDAYKAGLSKKPNDERLNQNSGLAAYQLNNYEEALKYYDKVTLNVERYLKSGNSNLKLGDKSSDPNGKLKLYQQAAETYKQGIIKFPENVDLKYNYEYVQKKINELQNKNDQNKQDSDKNDDKKENEENQENQNKDNQEGNKQDNKQDNKKDNKKDNKQDNQQDNQQDNNQDSKQDSKDQNSKDDKGKDSQDNNKSETNEGEKKDGQQSPKPQQGSDNKDGQNQNQNANQNKDKNNKNNNSSLSQAEKGQDKEAIAQAQRVLEMLEQQEEESLKNNQEIKNSGKGAEHDW